MRWTVMVALVGLAACGADAGASDGPATKGPEATGTYLDVAPPAVGEVAVIEPGGDTRCSRGTPYRFFVLGGDPTRIVLDFQGGGACWSDLTCSVADAIFFPEAPAADEIRESVATGQLQGIYRLDDPRNPFQGWTLVHVPYCTGDIHWGDATHDYGDDLVVHHRGFVNATAVRKWMEHQLPDAQQIFVTGCSAGAYGAIGHASYVAQAYPDAAVTVLGDSGAGVITADFFQSSFPNWNAEPALPTWLDGLAGRDIYTLSLADLYAAVANGHPGMRVAQYNTAFDKDQTFYYMAMGGDQTQWSATLFAQLAKITVDAPAFRYYAAPGQIHCLHPYDEFFTREVGGTAYVDWLRELTGGPAPPASVACEGDGCLSDPICDACLDGSSDAAICRWCSGWPPAP